MPPDAWLLLAVAAVVLVLAAWSGWTLTRLRRLDARVDRAWTTLDAQLQRRAALAAELAREHSAALGPEHADRLAATAREARSPHAGDRELAENALGHELRRLPPELPGVPSALRDDLDGTATRLGLARRFYNDAVRDTQALRTRRLPSLLRSRTSSPLPRFFDIDDGLELVGSGTGGRSGT